MNRGFIRERFSAVHDFAERVKIRWGIVFHATESLHASLLAEHGPDFMSRVQRVPQVPVSAEVAGHAERVSRSQVGENAVVAYEREGYLAQAQDQDSYRRETEALIAVDVAHHEAAQAAAHNERHHDYELPA